MISSKLSGLALAAAIGVVGTACSALAADQPKSVRIGYAISLSGPNAQGAAITTLSGYKLWVDDVNKKGGLKVQGFDKPIPIEVVEYDDTSNAENAVRLVERLMTQDKVDFVLPACSTGLTTSTASVCTSVEPAALRGSTRSTVSPAIDRSTSGRPDNAHEHTLGIP